MNAADLSHPPTVSWQCSSRGRDFWVAASPAWCLPAFILRAFMVVLNAGSARELSGVDAIRGEFERNGAVRLNQLGLLAGVVQARQDVSDQVMPIWP